MKNKIIEIFSRYDIKISEDQADKFCLYYKFLVQENQKYNLTAITEEDDVIFKHFLDSVLPIKSLKENSSLIDVGTGAGFPGVPLKILRPDLNIVLVDSLQKRINFLNQLINILKLEKIKAFHSRAEDFAIKNREKYDYATSRAVAQVNTLSEYLLPLVKVGGKVIMYKSKGIEDELKSGEKAILTLGGVVESSNIIKIKEIDAERSFAYIKKVKQTPKIYPRGKNLPKTKPIV